MHWPCLSTGCAAAPEHLAVSETAVRGKQRTTANGRCGFGQRLRKARKACGLSQRALGEAVGGRYGHSSVSYIESGTLQPRLHLAARLAEAVGVSLDWVCGRTDEPVFTDTDGRASELGRPGWTARWLKRIHADADRYVAASVAASRNDSPDDDMAASDAFETACANAAGAVVTYEFRFTPQPPGSGRPGRTRRLELWLRLDEPEGPTWGVWGLDESRNLYAERLVRIEGEHEERTSIRGIEAADAWGYMTLDVDWEVEALRLLRDEDEPAAATT